MCSLQPWCSGSCVWLRNWKCLSMRAVCKGQLQISIHFCPIGVSCVGWEPLTLKAFLGCTLMDCILACFELVRQCASHLLLSYVWATLPAVHLGPGLPPNGPWMEVLSQAEAALKRKLVPDCWALTPADRNLEINQHCTHIALLQP